MKSLLRNTDASGNCYKAGRRGVGFCIIPEPSAGNPAGAFPLDVVFESSSGQSTIHVVGPYSHYLDPADNRFDGFDIINATANAAYEVYVFEKLSEGLSGVPAARFPEIVTAVDAGQVINSAAGNFPTTAGQGLDLSGLSGFEVIVESTASNLTGGIVQLWRIDPTLGIWGPTDTQYAIGAPGTTIKPCPEEAVATPLGRIYAELRNVTGPTGNLNARYRGTRR